MSWRKYRKTQNVFSTGRKINKKTIKIIMRYFLVYKKMVSYKVKFIDSGRFIANPLSNFVNNLPELIHKVKCNDWKCFF